MGKLQLKVCKLRSRKRAEAVKVSIQKRIIIKGNLFDNLPKKHAHLSLSNRRGHQSSWACGQSRGTSVSSQKTPACNGRVQRAYSKNCGVLFSELGAGGALRVPSCPISLTWGVHSREVPGFESQVLLSPGVKDDSWFRENSYLFPFS